MVSAAGAGSAPGRVSHQPGGRAGASVPIGHQMLSLNPALGIACNPQSNFLQAKASQRNYFSNSQDIFYSLFKSVLFKKIRRENFSETSDGLCLQRRWGRSGR